MVFDVIPTWVREIFDIFVMVVFLAYIFKDIIRPKSGRDIVQYVDQGLLGENLKNEVWYDDLRFTISVVAPCIILHELAHKFVAIGFGYEAVFYAFYHQPFTLMLGILAILSVAYNWGFVLIVPGYVQISQLASPGASALIAFAGPLVHALFWATAKIVLSRGEMTSQRQHEFWVMTKKLNGFLFIFNMLPLPGIDGFAVYNGLFEALL